LVGKEVDVGCGRVEGEVVGIWGEELVAREDGNEEEEAACEETRCEIEDEDVEFRKELGKEDTAEDLCALDVLDTGWEAMSSPTDHKKMDWTEVVQTKCEKLEEKGMR